MNVRQSGIKVAAAAAVALAVLVAAAGPCASRAEAGRRDRDPSPPPPPVAAAPATERDCLMEYVRQRADPEAALAVLRGCVAAFPDSFSLSRTLGRRLLDQAGSDPGAGAEARGHLERAAGIDPGQFADDWLTLAKLQDAQHDEEAALVSYQRSLPFLEPEPRVEVADRLFTLHLARGHQAETAEQWHVMWHRRADDFDAQLGAGRALAAQGDSVAARSAFERALELRPGDATAQAALGALLGQAAAAGGVMAQAALLDSALERLASLDVTQLEQLLATARAALRPQVEHSIAAELLRRDAANGPAHAVLAEADWAAGRATEARSHAQKALAGHLCETATASAHAIVGLATAQFAHERWSKAGSQLAPALVASTAAEYREALRHLEAASRAGGAVGRELASTRSALAALEGLGSDIQATRARAEESNCGELASRARYEYDTNRPLRRSASGSVTLSQAAGASANLATLPAGTSVSVQDASWDERSGSCWIRVRADDGSAGWAPSGRFSEP